jgi:hypothetical protein
MVRPILAAVVLVQILCFAQLASAQTQKWDQAAVTQISVDLEKALSGLRDIVRSSPQFQVPSSRRAYLFEILENLRNMEFMAQSLTVRLKNGEGLEETTPTYNKMQQIRRDTEVIARKVDITAVVQPKLDLAREQLAKMAPYYPTQPQIEDIR